MRTITLVIVAIASTTLGLAACASESDYKGGGRRLEPPSGDEDGGVIGISPTDSGPGGPSGGSDTADTAVADTTPTDTAKDTARD